MSDIQYRLVDSISFAPEIITFNDLLVQMVDFAGAKISDVNARNWKNGISAAMRKLASMRDWKAYITQYTFQTNPSESVVGWYNHTGGGYERLFTVTTGTAPTWITYGTILYGGKVYEVDEIKSSTTFTLTLRNNPGADLGSGGSPVTVTAYRNYYPLPADFLRMMTAFINNGVTLNYVPPQDIDFMDRAVRSTGTPYDYTIVSSPKFVGQQLMRLNTSSTTAKTVALSYRRYARQLKRSGYGTNESGATASVVIATDANRVAVSAYTPAESMIGCVLRISSSTALPDGNWGSNPYVQQRVITEVNVNSGHLYTDRDFSADFTSVGYMITDPVDVAPYMIDALIARCRVEFARQQPKQANEILALEADWREQVNKAMESDSSYPSLWDGPIIIDRMHIQP
jgi:hypothetical protein